MIELTYHDSGSTIVLARPNGKWTPDSLPAHERDLARLGEGKGDLAVIWHFPGSVPLPPDMTFVDFIRSLTRHCRQARATIVVFVLSPASPMRPMFMAALERYGADGVSYHFSGSLQEAEQIIATFRQSSV